MPYRFPVAASRSPEVKEGTSVSTVWQCNIICCYHRYMWMSISIKLVWFTKLWKAAVAWSSPIQTDWNIFKFIIIICYQYSLSLPSPHEMKAHSWNKNPRRYRGFLCTKTKNQICYTHASKHLQNLCRLVFLKLPIFYLLTDKFLSLSHHYLADVDIFL